MLKGEEVLEELGKKVNCDHSSEHERKERRNIHVLSNLEEEGFSDTRNKCYVLAAK